MAATATPSSGRVADYFATLGIGENLKWKNDNYDEEALKIRFMREIVDLAIVSPSNDISSIQQSASFAEGSTTFSEGEPTIELEDLVTVKETCPANAGRRSSNRHQDQPSVSSSGANDSLAATSWTRYQAFDANLDPCYGFRREILAMAGVQESLDSNTPLKHIGRKVGTTLRHQFGPLLRNYSKTTSCENFYLAFRRRTSEQDLQPAVADVQLRYVRLHRDTICSPESNHDTQTSNVTVVKRGLATGASIAVRVAEAGKQTLMDKYRDLHGTRTVPGPQTIDAADEVHHQSVNSFQTTVVSLNEMLSPLEGFDDWVVPEAFKWIQIPEKSLLETEGFSSGGGTHGVSRDVNTSQTSDRSGGGVEAYYDASSVVVKTSGSDTADETSFEVIDPTAFHPYLVEEDSLPPIMELERNDVYSYIPVLAVRRQRVGEAEQYHEDPAVTDMAVSFLDEDGSVLLPEESWNDDDDEDDDENSPLKSSAWKSCYSPSGRVHNVSNSSSKWKTSRTPIVLVKRNNPIGFADTPLETRVLDRFPFKNYKGLPLPEEELPMFCYPTGYRLVRARYCDWPLPQYFGFVVKNEQGDSIFVSCVSFMEPISGTKLDQLRLLSRKWQMYSLPHLIKAQKKVKPSPGNCADNLLTGFDSMTTFENKTICLIGRYPFWTAFRRYLSHLHIISGSTSEIPLERHISHLLLEVPLPRPGGPCVVVPLAGLNEPMILSYPPTKDFPVCDLPFQRLFACLDVPTVVTIVLGLLSLERKLLVISRRPSLVLDVCELLKTLLFPLELCAPYVPRLTEPFMSCLDFPGAIFVGIHDDKTPGGLAASVRETLPEDSIMVDLDTGEIDCSGDRYDELQKCWSIIPHGPRSNLLSEVETLCRDAGIVPGQEPLDSQVDTAFETSVTPSEMLEDMEDYGHTQRIPLDDRAIRDAFLRFFTAILGCYERFLVPPDLDFKTSGSEWFDTQGFISEASHDRKSYLSCLVDTQLFQSFIQRRTEASDVHCLLFDECLGEYHASPIPYGRLGGDVETLTSDCGGQSQILYSLLVDEFCAEARHHAGSSFDNSIDETATGMNDLPLAQMKSSNEGDGVLCTPSRANLARKPFVYCINGNPCFPQKLCRSLFLPQEPDSLLVAISDSPSPSLVRSERELEVAIRRRKIATSCKGLTNQSKCMWQLPKLMGSHFLGAWLLCIPSQVSQLGIHPNTQSRYLLRALGALRLLRNKQRIVPDEASYRALMVACGCAASDHRVELAKLFGFLRADGIFPSAVTLGHYTRALADGYSKRSSTAQDDGMLFGAAAAGLGEDKSTDSHGCLSVDPEGFLSTLDGNIATLESSGLCWRSRAVQGRDGTGKRDTEEEKATDESQGGKRKKKNVVRSWLPVLVSSSFVPNRESHTTSSQELLNNFRLIAMWSRTTSCIECGYAMLDEEIQGGWNVVGIDNFDDSTVSCTRCGSTVQPKLGYHEMTVAEAKNWQTQLGQSPVSLPCQLHSTILPANDNVVLYLSPAKVRSRLEMLIEQHGDKILERDTLKELDPVLFFNFWWYSARFSLPLPLPVYDSRESQACNKRASNYCAFAAYSRNIACRGCQSAAELLSERLDDHYAVSSETIPADDFPLLSRFKLQAICQSDWDNDDLSKVLVALVEACDKRDFKPAVECILSSNRGRGAAANSQSAHRQDSKGPPLDCYNTMLYLAKYQCTTAFHVFFPASTRPCKGYHFWCAFGTPLPIFDRLFRDAVDRIRKKEHSVIQINYVSDIALGFRCVFGHII